MGDTLDSLFEAGVDAGLGTGIPALAALFDALGISLAEGPAHVIALVAVFLRVGAVALLLPGFGEEILSPRIRLAGALALTLVVWPMVLPGLALPGTAPAAVLHLFLAEAVAGLMLGLGLRFLVIALQLAGSIAAQATSISQIAGAGVTPDPMPAIGNILVLGGITLALIGGLHVKAALMLAWSYQALPFGLMPGGPDLTGWGVAQAARVFSLAVTLAGPFVLLSFLYNLALGAINRAMPQLMVAFVGAPFITGASLVLLVLTVPVLLPLWRDLLDAVLADPLAPPR